jgi:nucleoid-associated protein YgaU
VSEKKYAKAEIRSVEANAGPEIKCMFNPKEYSFAKKNKWSQPKAKGGNVPEFEFGGGDPATLTLQLFFDTFETGEDVRAAHTDAVWKLMMIDPSLKDHTTQKGRPPKVRFQWGVAWSFEAVITSITQKFTLFGEDGTPLRATLDVSFQQVKDALFWPPQNPTSGGLGGGRQWTVKEGDSLSSIAFAEYGDPNHWRPIAEANQLVQVRRLRPGMTLEIPTLA